MTFSLKSLSIAILVSGAVSAALTRYYWPSVSVQTVVEEREVVKNNVVTVTRTIKRPDGTVERVKESTDTSTKVADKVATKTEYKQIDWLVGAGVTDALKYQEINYNFSVYKRFMGPVFIGLQVDTQANLSLNALLEF